MKRSHAFPAAMLAVGLALVAGFGSPVDAAQAPGTGQGDSVKTAAPVDVNRATVDELVAVPGIGEALAKRIVEFRSKNGPFERVDDLLKVRGIGEKSLEKLRPHLRAGAGK